jgi:hypothetical protein
MDWPALVVLSGSPVRVDLKSDEPITAILFGMARLRRSRSHRKDQLGSVMMVMLILMLGPVLVRRLVVPGESADRGPACRSDESTRQNRASTEHANGRATSRPNSTPCHSSFFPVRQRTPRQEKSNQYNAGYSVSHLVLSLTMPTMPLGASKACFH